MKVLHEKCDPKLAQDKKLPYTAYLVEYVDKENGEEKTFYDITTCLKQTDMFDYTSLQINEYQVAAKKAGLKWIQ